MDKSFGDARKKAEQFSAATKNISTAASSAGQAAAKSAPKIGKFVSSIARIAKYRMIRAVIRGIVDAIKEGWNNFYEFSKNTKEKHLSFAASLKAVQSAAGTMKNQLGAAFAQLFANIQPIIIKLIDLAIRLANAITMLFARLGGKDGWYKAADGANAAADAIGGAGTAAKKALRYLAPFDELNVLPSNDNGGGGGGGGSSGSSGGDYEWVPFENLDIGAGIQEFIGKIRDAFNNAAEWIENIDWQEVGHTIYDSFIWALTEIDWSGLASSFFRMFGAALGGASAVVVTFVSDLWADIKSYFLQFIDADGDGQWCGEDIVRGIFQGIWNAMKSAYNWIKEYIFTPFIDGFKAAFGIASPAKEMEEPGEMVGQGILVGIAAPFKAIGAWIKENILDPIKKVFDGETGFEFPFKITLPEGVLKTLEKIKTIWNGIKSKKPEMEPKLKGWSDTKQKALDKLKSAWGNINTKTSELTAKLKQGFQTSVLEKLKGLWDSVKDKAATFTANLKNNTAVQKFIDAWNGLKDKALSLKVGIAETVRSAWNTVVDKWNASWLAKQLGTLPRMANGGMLDAGQIFVARESGPEIVGQFGNKTGVMNNQQIVAAVSSGVANAIAGLRFSVSSTAQTYNSTEANEETLYRAMLRALNSADRQPFEIDLDGNVIYRDVVRRNRNNTRMTGVNALA